MKDTWSKAVFGLSWLGVVVSGVFSLLWFSIVIDHDPVKIPSERGNPAT